MSAITCMNGKREFLDKRSISSVGMDGLISGLSPSSNIVKVCSIVISMNNSDQCQPQQNRQTSSSRPECVVNIETHEVLGFLL